ncbi:hypothetical protein [Nocardioides solisilvae]|uniref:SWIM zinc finger family protein n=1 Tax=Nocardioides solisilvae TaxID=1542435 RepID=UPI000D74DA7F|nr:hypothetical protein [Nocardioides solisilvae]
MTSQPVRVTHPRLPPRPAGGRGVASTWWGKAWTRSLEEAAYGVEELRGGGRLARAGAVGAIAVEVGSYVATVEERHAVHTVTGSVEPLDDVGAELFVEVVAGASGTVAALLAGELPLALVEACEEVGVELVPYAGELGWSCSCDAWVDPCAHGLAVAVQVGWLAAADPLLLLHLRGLPREELLARVHAVTAPAGDAEGAGAEGVGAEVDDDLETGTDAALRAEAMLAGWTRDDRAGVSDR